MNFPGSYSQQDKRWSGQLLGFNTDPQYTIGRYGCLVTALSNMLWYMGQPQDPGLVNGRLKALNGFVDGGEVVWSVVPQLCSGLTAQGMASYEQANQFVETDGNFAVIQVTAPGFPMHFVLLIDPGRIVDSWDGGLKHWPSGYTFVAAHLYGGPTAFSTGPQPASQPVMAANQEQGEDPAVIAQLQQELTEATNIANARKAQLDQIAQAVSVPNADNGIQVILNNIATLQQAFQAEQAAAPVESVPAAAAPVAPPEPVATPQAQAEPVAVVQEPTKISDVGGIVMLNPAPQPTTLDVAAVVTDLRTGKPLSLVPAGTPIHVVASRTFEGDTYLVTKNMVEGNLDHGIDSKFFKTQVPVDSIQPPVGVVQELETQPVAAALEHTGKAWTNLVNALDKFHNKK